MKYFYRYCFIEIFTIVIVTIEIEKLLYYLYKVHSFLIRVF